MKKLLLATILLFTACAQKEKVDLILTNAKVYTVNPNFETAEAIAIKDGKFVGVGSKEEITSKFQTNNIHDLAGNPVYPGFIDAHCHFLGLGMNQQTVDLVGTKSMDEVLEKVVAFQKSNPSSFVYGRGWDQNDWEDKNFPNKLKLDLLFPDIPVALERIDGHAYLVNQKALDLAKITIHSEATDGYIEQIDGQLTGILIDGPMDRIESIRPTNSKETLIRALQDAQKICFDYGLTTVNDAGLSKESILLIDSLQQAGALQMRIYAMVSNSPQNLDYFLKRGKIKTDYLNVRSVKVYADGALGSRGAALKESYSDRHHHFGAMITTAEELDELAQRIAAADFQMNTHAIGDSANVAVLRAYTKAIAAKKDPRWKVEHAQVITGTDFDYFKKGIIPSVQPTHATSDMYWAAERLGEERVQGAYAYKTLLEKAGILALGTDFPVERVSPFLTFYAAIARQDTAGYPKGGFQMKDALSREETLRGMTIWAAYSNFEENEKGSIEVGKFADFIILDQDIMVANPASIPNTKVLGTFVHGKKVGGTSDNF
ncbi:MAG: amidohydrolase [Flavobacteriaceae bacterium]|nr:amidohydrolase [Flavobacteriaceae bacterium]